MAENQNEGQPAQDASPAQPCSQQPYGQAVPGQAPSQPPYQGYPYQPGQAPGQMPYQQPNYVVKNHATSSLVLGVLSIVFGFISPLVAWILGGFGLHFASRDRKNFGPRASRAGRNCSIVGIVIGLFMWIATVFLLITSGEASSIVSSSNSMF